MAKGLNFGFRGAEILGLGQHPKRMRDYIDSLIKIKAQQVMGKTITPEMPYEFAKYSKASGATLSDRFKMTTFRCRGNWAANPFSIGHLTRDEPTNAACVVKP
jgi:hypothetical protein